MYRNHSDHVEVLLVHPGGPFWIHKDKGAWSIPKGEYTEGEHPLEAAQREFREETNFSASGPFLELGTIKQAGGKFVIAWAFRGNCNPAELKSNLCQTEWPPHSGRQIEFPEVDRASWFSIAQAKEHILKSQEPLLDNLCQSLRLNGTD